MKGLTLFIDSNRNLWLQSSFKILLGEKGLEIWLNMTLETHLVYQECKEGTHSAHLVPKTPRLVGGTVVKSALQMGSVLRLNHGNIVPL